MDSIQCKETAVANFMLALTNIHDWIKTQWTRAAQGEDDLATVAYSCNAARILARQILHEVNLNVGWQDPIFLKYAEKAGIISNKDEHIFEGAGSTFIVILRYPNQLRWHVYSDFGDHMQAPNFNGTIGTDTLTQLERWLFCAALSGWDTTQELTGIQERCLLTALELQIRATKNLTGAKTAAFCSQLEKVESFSQRIRSLKFAPDPWTLSHILAQTTALIYNQDIALSIDRLEAAVYCEKYQALAGNSANDKLLEDFKWLLPTCSLETVRELENAWKGQPSQANERTLSSQWVWKVFHDEHFPTMFADFRTSQDHIDMLDKIRGRLSTILRRRLNTDNLPDLPHSRGRIAFADVPNLRLRGELYRLTTITRMSMSKPLGIDAKYACGEYYSFSADADINVSAKTMTIFASDAPFIPIEQLVYYKMHCAHGYCATIDGQAEEVGQEEWLECSDGRFEKTVVSFDDDDDEIAMGRDQLKDWVLEVVSTGLEVATFTCN